MPYADAETQTIWAGLTKADVRPDILLTAPDTTTPPAEMITAKPQGFDPPISAAQLGAANLFNTAGSSGMSLLERRQNRPVFTPHISLPNSTLDDELIPSPPPTQAMVSPLPEANKRHAGHTPLIPRALSPVQPDEEQAAETLPVEDDRSATPEHDRGLMGPLMLPTNPVDGASDHIALDALDSQLSRIARNQDRFNKLKDAPELTAAAALLDDVDDEYLSLSRKGSSDSRKSSTTEVMDGVKLKSPPLNFGAPLGQA
ncbi:hypothetical protein EJ02DRAFT_454486 [Clathrospora elynae]|uniref:Uncharacterized protein n=1 Tax=Clathrospora elynae TaxID=706981 RepID=A0A6A5SR83_9PLEO|nr:hypothetical protein EJ02DRAFT_454486 [Clathrospora elynae]